MSVAWRHRSALAACLLAVAGLAGGLASAQTLPDAGQAPAVDEKAQIERERDAAEARYRARERECRERFIVTSCVEDAQRQRRATLEALRARQLKLDEARRRGRAAERRAEIAAKTADDAKRAQAAQERDARTPALPGEARQPRQPREPRQTREAREPREAAGTRRDAQPPRQAREGSSRQSGESKAKAPRVDDPAERRAREERHRAEFEARQRKAAEHRAQSAERTIKRMHDREPAAPLPVPSASTLRGASPASAP
jgi:hypothetical protein